jgi:hypothetical protein
MTMTPNPPTGDTQGTTTPIPVEQLTESYRFDAELAQLLTAFQYDADDITLTVAADRPVPQATLATPTPGLEAVFGSESSLVFVCYDHRGQRMVNATETTLISALATAVVDTPQPPRPDGGPTEPLSEGPPPDDNTSEAESKAALSLGVVTPHNAQRGALDTRLPEDVTANTVEKYQGGQRDIIAVSATVSDPEFARQEERFILNPRRLLVAISRSRLLTIVVCSTALFEVAPEDSERLAHGPVWARLFTQAVGRDADPAWAGPLGDFVDDDTPPHATVPVRVYPSTIGTDGGNR